jgi:hypothetical protein
MRKNFYASTLCLACLLSLASCKSENPNPETLDPIYRDLSTKRDQFGSQMASSQKELETLDKERPELKPGTIEMINNIRDSKRARQRVAALKQLHDFYEIRTQRRLVEGRLAYKQAFAKDQEWPNPKEIAEYETSERLKLAPRSWDARVPKWPIIKAEASEKSKKSKKSENTPEAE